MSQRFDALLEKSYPALYHLLVEIAANQYATDWLHHAVTEFFAHADEADRRNILREIDAAAEHIVAEYDEIAQLTNYNLASVTEARAFLATLHRQVAQSLADHS